MLVLCTVLYTDVDIVMHRMVLNPLGVNRGSRKADVSRHVKWSDDRLGRCFSKSNGGWVQSAVGRLTREMHRVSCRSLHAQRSDGRIMEWGYGRIQARDEIMVEACVPGACAMAPSR